MLFGLKIKNPVFNETRIHDFSCLSRQSWISKSLGLKGFTLAVWKLSAGEYTDSLPLLTLLSLTVYSIASNKLSSEPRSGKEENAGAGNSLQRGTGHLAYPI